MGSSSFSSALSTILPCFNTKYFPQFDPFHLQLPLTDSLFIILSESHFHVSTFDKIVQTVFLGEPSVRSVDSKNGYSVFGCKIEPSMCAFLLGDKDYLSANQQFEK